MKRSIIIPGLLTIYLIIMGIIGWPRYAAEGKYWEFAGIATATIIVIVLLYFVLKRRDKMRRENRKQREASLRRNFRDDNIR
ncbi:MAG: hypothetical protein ACRCSQ_09200 [Bacteroidales bacterium]